MTHGYGHLPVLGTGGAYNEGGMYINIPYFIENGYLPFTPNHYTPPMTTMTRMTAFLKLCLLSQCRF